MSEIASCSRAFPDECRECPDYVEEIDTTLDVALAGCLGFYSGPAYAVKRCTRFKRESYMAI
jgi:hypothetical protein